MKKPIQICSHHDGLFALTEDGKIYFRAGTYNSTWKEIPSIEEDLDEKYQTAKEVRERQDAELKQNLGRYGYSPDNS